MSRPSETENAEPMILEGKRLVLIGRMASMARRDAAAIAREHGAVVCEKIGPNVNMLVIGEGELPIGDEGDPDHWLDDEWRKAFEEGAFEIVSETQLWQRLGLAGDDQDIRRLYTPAMLADMLDVPVATIRRWHRRGLIVPAKQVHQLPYFDFREASTARRLAQLLASGMSASAIERRLESLAKLVPGVKRPLAQLSVIVEGGDILLRRESGLVEAGGQRRFDFDALEEGAAEEGAALSDEEHEIAGPRKKEPVMLDVALRGGPITGESTDSPAPTNPVELRRWAGELEDEGLLDHAAEAYRASLMAGGPDARACFAMAEIFYRQGDLAAARERYSMAIEIDETFVEARANLGCVLSELGRYELAAAAFEGALQSYEGYSDVHYHLALAFEKLDRHDEATAHFRRFLELAPESPWAEQARARIASGER